MPEGHTVHRLAGALNGLFGGEILAVSSPQGRFEGGAALLDGRRLVAAEAWGKQLFCAFAPTDPPAGPHDDVRWLRVHLGLYGAWTFAGDPSTGPGGSGSRIVHAIGAPRRRIGERETTPVAEPGGAVDGCLSGEWVAPAPRGAVRLRLLGAHAVADLTGPTACEVLTGSEKAAVEARLGPDPIRAGTSGDGGGRAEFVARVRRSRVTVGQQLMDQAVIAGVGNIYRAEALFRAGVDPLGPGRDVPETAIGAIWDDLVVLMRDGATTGAIVTTRPEHRVPDGVHGAARRTRQNTDGAAGAVPSDEAFYVYHRDGLPCRVCGAPVLTKELVGRNLFWCGVCQA
ncbi:Fpg/Nei family DNA glycosylase [Krasilnikoviella flava]|uniref:DNA-(apurinic or apyrimidinic site) lyase n=1 Tax=Krasilnikoviella flava TaxID=526729 RepID=A0A1T5LQE0_9MICO|nr:zinc finger domain-containing protein [Krasilnikoviella flava]SKC78141.1 endonuclease-8 [Krasilnikoviella flava]